MATIKIAVINATSDVVLSDAEAARASHTYREVSSRPKQSIVIAFMWGVLLKWAVILRPAQPSEL